jgi:hypothetical protein
MSRPRASRPAVCWVATLLLYGNGVALLPPIIVAGVTAYIAVGWLDRSG